MHSPLVIYSGTRPTTGCTATTVLSTHKMGTPTALALEAKKFSDSEIRVVDWAPIERVTDITIGCTGGDITETTLVLSK